MSHSKQFGSFQAANVVVAEDFIAKQQHRDFIDLWEVIFMLVVFGQRLYEAIILVDVEFKVNSVPIRRHAIDVKQLG